MFFLGYNFLGCDEAAIPISPVIPSDNDAIEVSGVWADTLAVTKRVYKLDEHGKPIPDGHGGYVLEPLTADVNTEWDFDTILIADFNNDTMAGNVKWVLRTVSHIAIKRRIVGTNKWITIAIKEVSTVDDLNIGGTDITCESLEYEYALVPYFNNIEGDYSPVTVDVTNSDLVVIDRSGIYHTPVTDGYCDVTDVHPNSVLELLHNKYPTVVRNTIANYETITVTGTFLPFKDDDCVDLSVYDDSPQNDRRRHLYSREVKDFLTNGRTKILKNVDGQCWMVYVTTPPTDTADNYYNVRKLQFGCTETGNLKSEEDLFYAGLLDVPAEWWNSNT